MTPRSQAIAFRIWAYCDPRGWGLTYNEIADETGAPLGAVVAVIKAKGWAARFAVENKTIRMRAGHHFDGHARMEAPERTMDTPHRYLSDEVLQ